MEKGLRTETFRFGMTNRRFCGLYGLSKETFRQAIQKEWTLETTHERIYRFNLVRWGTYLTVMKEYFQKNFPEKVKNVTEERLYFPCPEHDSLINPNL